MIYLPQKGMPFDRVKPRRYLDARRAMLKQQQANYPVSKKNKLSRSPGPVFTESPSLAAHIILLITILLGSLLLLNLISG